MAADFSLTKVFFVEQLSSYWIPLEINFSNKKDLITVKAMLIKKRKVESPTLYNLNSVLLNFKEKALFPLTSLLAMYPIPPNKYPWDIIIFKSYNQDLNRLYVNDVLITAASLPQAFNIADLSTIKFEANKVTDIVADKNSDSFYIQAIDTNGGVSNEAYINVVHTGVASLESNFKQAEEYRYARNKFDKGSIVVSPNTYVLGLKPNLNTTIQQTETKVIDASHIANDTFNLVEVTDNYTNVRIDTAAFPLYLRTRSGGKARAIATIIVSDGVNTYNLYQVSSAGNAENTFSIPALTHTLPNVPIGRKIRVYFHFLFYDTRGSILGNMDVELTINNWEVKISTSKTI